ncbi:hypothetical protein EV421DRAFT_1502049 [Armillaria borealis]|uniref:Secreted protein n=1 Tax=Armillaria borealis TaxID=47425 RepID=A0AA39MFL7_9AGAR|nr:hypothetical protein EV421DRAFT_1502049 [Armillaria borealis]
MNRGSSRRPDVVFLLPWIVVPFASFQTNLMIPQRHSRNVGELFDVIMPFAECRRCSMLAYTIAYREERHHKDEYTTNGRSNDDTRVRGVFRCFTALARRARGFSSHTTQPYGEQQEAIVYTLT